MPELPEVETIRRGLQPIEGTRLVGVEVRETRLRRRVDRRTLADLVGRRMGRLGRRAKYLLMPTTGGGGMIVHLGMSGRMFMAANTPVGAHDHVSWWFEHGGREFELRFRDPRRFGLVAATRDRRLRVHPLLARLGPEPLEEAFSVDYLSAAANGSRRPVKNALMDARFVAGVGNIYASEVLWNAGVHPKTRAGRISAARWRAIHAAVRRVLGEAIDAGGTTLNDFRSASGEPGYFQVNLRVYGRDGEPCRRCAGIIRRILQAGRATYYCGRCQH